MTPIQELLLQHEGFRPTCYRDTTGHLTIGIGFNLDAAAAQTDCTTCGLNYPSLRSGSAITMDQAVQLLELGIQRAQDAAKILVRGFSSLPVNAQLVVTDMIFNLGFSGFAQFRNLIAALEAKPPNWIAAAAAMRDSEWYTQVGYRALDDINLILHAGD